MWSSSSKGRGRSSATLAGTNALAVVIAIGCAAQHSGDGSTRRDLDILLVVDDTRNAEVFQAHFGDFVNAVLLRLLAGDYEHDGVRDFEPPASIHVGVIDGDLGIGGASVDAQTTGHCTPLGDGAILRTTTLDGYSHAAIMVPAPDALGETEALVAPMLGTTACRIQQPLEATLAALTPAPRSDGTPSVTWTRTAYTAPTFVPGLEGRAGPGGANEGLVREQSVLVMIVLAGNYDCSTPRPEEVLADQSLWFTESCRYAELDGTVLYPVDRYVSGLLALRTDPDRLVFTALTGIPIDVADSTAFDDILARPEMSLDVVHDGCATFTGHAPPGRRIVQAAAGVAAGGARARVYSICEETEYAHPIPGVLADIVAAMGGA